MCLTIHSSQPFSEYVFYMNINYNIYFRGYFFKVLWVVGERIFFLSILSYIYINICIISIYIYCIYLLIIFCDHIQAHRKLYLFSFSLSQPNTYDVSAEINFKMIEIKFCNEISCHWNAVLKILSSFILNLNMARHSLSNNQI